LVQVSLFNPELLTFFEIEDAAILDFQVM